MAPEMARLVLLLESSVYSQDDFDKCMEQGHSLREASEALQHLSDLAFTKASAMVGAPMAMPTLRQARPS